MAPTIAELPDVIVGDAENSTQANVFVFLNCTRLNASDDLTPGDQLKWSYVSEDNVYMVNGTAPIDLLVDDVVNPPNAKRLDTHNDPLDTGSPGTATVRDNLRSPVGEKGGLGPYPESHGTSPTGTGIIDSRVVTLFASDGTTFSSRSFIVYTNDNGYDQYSAPKIVYSADPITTVPTGWSYAQNWPTPAGPPELPGLCIKAEKGGTKDASWNSPYGVVSLTDYSAWEVRMKVATTAVTAFHTPTWMLVYDNYGNEENGNNEYGGETFFVDNEGGANSPIAGIGRSEFSVFIMPVQQLTPQFGQYSHGSGWTQPTIWDARNDMRLIFRVMGIPQYPPDMWDAESVALQSIVVIKHDLLDMKVDSTVMNVTSFVDGVANPGNPRGFSIDAQGTTTTLTFNMDGTATIAPETNWNDSTYVLFRPGDKIVQENGQYVESAFADNYPIRWVADSLYYIEFMLSAPSAWAELNQPDIIRVGADTFTNELLSDNFLVPNTPELYDGKIGPTTVRGVSTPRYGTPQRYTCFFYTNSVSKTAVAGGARWRPKLDLATRPDISPNGRTDNLAGFTVHSLTVKKVHFLDDPYGKIIIAGGK
ncbi:MAG: hypothetical protein ABFD69_09210 [Candidatus Sumerlaeia bacterium]